MSDPSPKRRSQPLAKRPADDKALKTESDVERLIAGETKPDLSQMPSILEKLLVVIADYLEGGRHLKIRLTPVEIASTLSAAIAEADGTPSLWPDGADARTFFVHGLYDEIIQQPSNIFEIRRFPDGTERYVPINKALWRACLERLREQLLKNSKTSRKRA